MKRISIDDIKVYKGDDTAPTSGAIPLKGEERVKVLECFQRGALLRGYSIWYAPDGLEMERCYELFVLDTRSVNWNT